MSDVVHRRAVRVLVVDPDQRVLMIHGFDPHQPGTTYWYTVGGGVHPGEGDREAAIREVWEETGRTTLIDDLRGPVHHDDVVFPFEGRTIVQEQVYPEGLAALVAAASSSGGSSASRPTASETTTSAPTSQNWL